MLFCVWLHLHTCFVDSYIVGSAFELSHLFQRNFRLREVSKYKYKQILLCYNQIKNAFEVNFIFKEF